MTKPAPDLDLQAIFNNPKALETAIFKRPLDTAEKSSRLKIQEWNAKINYVKDILLWVTAIILVGVFMYICISVLTNPTSSTDDKKWAMTIIGSTVTGLIGYRTGKSHKEPST